MPLETLHEITIGDVWVPAVTIVTSVMQRHCVSDSDLQRAASFDPDHWSSAAADVSSPNASSAKRASMPFGAGPRKC